MCTLGWSLKGFEVKSQQNFVFDLLINGFVHHSSMRYPLPYFYMLLRRQKFVILVARREVVFMLSLEILFINYFLRFYSLECLS